MAEERANRVEVDTLPQRGGPYGNTAHICFGYLHRSITDCHGNWCLETTIILLIPIIPSVSDSGRVWLGNLLHLVLSMVTQWYLAGVGSKIAPVHCRDPVSCARQPWEVDLLDGDSEYKNQCFRSAGSKLYKPLCI